MLLSLILLGLVADQNIQPLAREFMTPLDEGMVMDMPITIPRASVSQSADDLKARDMVFCRFPEVDMVVGKAGRAETPTDPAPIDMIETMINFRPPEFWPRRKLRTADAQQHAGTILDALVHNGLLRPPGNAPGRAELVNEVVMARVPVFDAQMREYAYQRNQDFVRDLGNKLVYIGVERIVAALADNQALRRALTSADIILLGNVAPQGLPQRLAQGPSLHDVTELAKAVAEKLKSLQWVESGGDLLVYRPNVFTRSILAMHGLLGGTPPTLFTRLHDALNLEYRTLWQEHLHRLNAELMERGAGVYTRLAIEGFLENGEGMDPQIEPAIREIKRFRSLPPASGPRQSGHHHGGESAPVPVTATLPHSIVTVQDELTHMLAGRILLWRSDRLELTGFGGELDRVMQMPGWTNVWTMPIQNRVDMLSTGVNTAIGIRVLGARLDDIVRASNDIAAAVKKVRGAADVIADPIRGKGYLEIRVDRERAARQGVSVGDVNDLVETAMGGKIVTTVSAGRERHPVRVRLPRAWRESEESVSNLLVPAHNTIAGPPQQVPLAQVSDIRIVEGPASIKSENGILRNYVKLNVRGRDAVDFVVEAQQVIAQQVVLPPGVHVEWTGQFEHQVRAGNTLLVIVPLVVGLIFLILYLTYHDLADALLMLAAVPGAIAGGVFFQWLFGYKFSVTVWVGYIACFGMATSTGIIMLVYLREAVAKAGGLTKMTLDQLHQAVMNGAVHRLRPKLLTEATIVIGLGPMLWATGVGADVIKPMAAPVLGGILIADEVIDLLLPVLFYWVRRWRWERLHEITSQPAEATKGTHLFF
jgi:Cu(I)/Ag(I) efflux system membrane protein CusA/SilA